MKKNNTIEKILLSCDTHHYLILNINLIVYIPAVILLWIYHNPEHGFKEANISFDLLVPIFILINYLLGYHQSNVCKDEYKRSLTLIFLCYLATSISLLFITICNIYIVKTSGTESLLLLIPLFTVALFVCIKLIPTVIKKAKEEIKLYLKFFWNKH